MILSAWDQQITNAKDYQGKYFTMQRQQFFPFRYMHTFSVIRYTSVYTETRPDLLCLHPQ